MPETNASAIDPWLMQQYSQYFDPSAFQTPEGYGQQPSNTNSLTGNPLMDAGVSASSFGISDLASGNYMGALMPGLGSLMGGLFGGGEGGGWKPYVDANGNFVWTDPKKKNPVPIATVPGAPLKPSGQTQKMADQVQAIVNLLPAYSQAVSGQIIPQALAQLAAEQAVSPGRNQLMLDLYRQFGPQLNQVGSDIARQNQLAQAETDLAVLQGPGQETVRSALETARIYDPEYFATRELSSNRIGDLLRSINLDSGLTPTERMEIERSQAQEGARRGTYNAPSNLDTVSNAMQFGEAGNKRLQQNRSNLSSAISLATASLPSFKSGVDTFQIATGKSSVPNAGAGQFGGINQTGPNNALGLAQGLLTNSTALNTTQMQIDANKKDWADYLSQVTSSIGSLTSSAGGIAGIACWVARKVYGEDNPKWKIFRDYLFNKAPKSLRELYLNNGESIANNLTEDQIPIIKRFMDKILLKEYSII